MTHLSGPTCTDQHYWATQVERVDIGRSGPHIHTDGARRAAMRLKAL